ncbi:hypothetical protein QBC34DRAFT_484187 [Podospora aff. communis PSN243]|uniref:Uncharacterized protein n=1 Tax=Podospora aff. communis PSN243 TaxID=3040156 RepID=A0AAV9GSJ2_9PEZI|nr:hypothetical protein QBC34DRAFT_484187 [Podospora aff. communis PSN243]
MDNKTASVSTLRVVEELESPSSRKGGPPSPPFSDSERTESRDGNARLRFWENVRASPARPLLWSFAAYFVFTVLYCLFIHHVLIRGKPRVGVIMFDATTSNLLISIFSQFFVLLCDSVIFGLLDVMRTALASRDGGTSASAFFGISAATGWLSTFRLASVTGFRDLWCNFRLMIPVLGLLFGSVLKFKATFDYHFTPSDITKEVYAGLVPIDIRLLSNVRTADLWVYFQAFTSILLGHPRYSVPYHIDQCQTNCKSFLLPGGLEMARQYSPFLNQTLFNGGIFNTTEAIRIEASRGLALSFEHMGSGYEFDWAAECLYPDLPDGEQPDRVQLCVHQSTPSSVIAGWTSCPEAVWQNNSCATDPSWMRRPMPWTVKMTAYYQSATVTYDRDNGSIIDLRAIPHHPSTPPELIDVPLSAKDYLDLWRKILIPEPPKNTSTTRIELTRTKINSILYDITWLHRTYEVTFPDQKDAPLTYLSNFLAVPLQFGVVAVEFANYTVPKAVVDAFLDGKGFLLPEELRTVAWTGWVFIGGAIVMLVLAAVGIAWVLSRPVKGIGRSGIPELDILRSKTQYSPSMWFDASFTPRQRSC